MLKPLTVQLPENIDSWLRERARRDFDTLSRAVAKILIEKYAQENEDA